MLNSIQRKKVKQKLLICMTLGDDTYLIADHCYWDSIVSILKEISNENQLDFTRKDTDHANLSEIKAMLLNGGLVLFCKSKVFHGHFYSFMRECSERDFRQVYLRDTLETIMVSNSFFFVFLISPEDDNQFTPAYRRGLKSHLHQVWFPNWLE